MNRKAIMGLIFWTPLLIILYLYLWIFMFGPVMAQFGVSLADREGLTGLHGFLWRTMNIWGGLLPLLAYILWAGYMGGEQ